MTLLTRFFRSPRTGDRSATIELLSRPGCHLCVDAYIALSQELSNVQVRVVDITMDAELEEEYVFRIPVVLHRGDVLAEGTIGRAEARQVRDALKRRANRSAEPQ